MDLIVTVLMRLWLAGIAGLSYSVNNWDFVFGVNNWDVILCADGHCMATLFFVLFDTRSIVCNKHL